MIEGEAEELRSARSIGPKEQGDVSGAHVEAGCEIEGHAEGVAEEHADHPSVRDECDGATAVLARPVCHTRMDAPQEILQRLAAGRASDRRCPNPGRPRSRVLAFEVVQGEAGPGTALELAQSRVVHTTQSAVGAE